MENVAKARGKGEVLAFSELQTGTRISQLTANSIVAQIVYTKNGGNYSQLQSYNYYYEAYYYHYNSSNNCGDNYATRTATVPQQE